MRLIKTVFPKRFLVPIGANDVWSICESNLRYVNGFVGCCSTVRQGYFPEVLIHLAHKNTKILQAVKKQ